MGVPSAEQLAEINKLSRRALTADEIYVFSVVLCDNETDRDFERFSVEALKKLSVLYIGKTGIYDHSMKAKDQVARVFACTVEEVTERYTASGEPYYRLKALAYMPRSVRNEDIILEIDTGIKKEVSVGCSVGTKRCSVCGADRRLGACEHQNGRFYRVKGKKQLCHTVLDDPLDAYEWSFVAVPAQPEAGVTKGFISEKGERGEKGGKGVMYSPDAIKSLMGKGETVLTPAEAKGIYDYIACLEGYKEVAKQYIENLKGDVFKLSAVVQSDIPKEVVEEITDNISAGALLKFKESLERKLDSLMPPKTQLISNRIPEQPGNTGDNKQFLI